MASVQRKRSKGYFLVDVTNGGANRRWEKVSGSRGITVTPSETTPNSDEVFDADVDQPYDYGSDTSNMTLAVDEIVWNEGGDATEFLADNKNKVVPLKVVFTDAEVLFTSKGDVANTETYTIAAMTGAWIGSVKMTVEVKGTAELPNTSKWTEGTFVKIGDDFLRISRRIDATNFVLTKPGDDLTVASTVAAVADATATWKVGTFPFILGDKDAGFQATVLSAGISGAAINDVVKGTASFQPAGNAIPSKTYVDIGDPAAAPTVAA